MDSEFKSAAIAALALIGIAGYATYTIRRTRLRRTFRFLESALGDRGLVVLRFMDQEGIIHAFEGAHTSWKSLPDKRSCRLSTESFLYDTWRSEVVAKSLASSTKE